MMDNDYLTNLPINDDSIKDTIQKKFGKYKGTRIKGKDQKELIKEVKFRKKVKKKSIGFTNKLAISIMVLLFIGLILGYDLAVRSINMQYTGALMCYTAVLTPIGTACSIVLAKVVEKNRSENMGSDGTGITFASAQANNFKTDVDEFFDNSPAI